jgi:cyclophilin family peptidyl-prolyl cis-trans isomerase
MIRSCILLSTLLLLPALAQAEEPAAPADDAASQPTRVEMVTSLGTIVLELDPVKAPITVDNFIRYARDGFYNGTIFHRVMKGFMIQGGGFTPEMDKKEEGLRPGIKNEWRNGLKNVRGAIAMARLGNQPDSATAQFFINVVDNPGLDQARDGAAYAVFGKVVEGMDVVDAIRNTPVVTHPKYPSPSPVVPAEPVIIKEVTVTTGFQTEPERLAAYVKKLEGELDKKARQTDSGLYVITLQEGEGESPTATQKVAVHYTGWLLDGTKFDSSHDHPGGQPTEFFLNRVIAGWREGVTLMKVGEKARLVIPSQLAYGTRGEPRANIPPHAPLTFEVELLRIVQ